MRAAAAAESDDVAPLDARTLRAWDHVELSMGFLAGQRRYTQTPWTLDQSGALPGTSALVDPLKRASYDNVSMLGVRYDARLVVSYVRMTVGFDLPFAATGLGGRRAPARAKVVLRRGVGRDRARRRRALGRRALRRLRVHVTGCATDARCA